MSLRWMRAVTLISLLAIFALLVVPNARSIYEGVFFYLRFAVQPTDPVQPVAPSGPFSSIYDLVQLRNADRYNYILNHLNLSSAAITQIPIPNYPQPDLLVTFPGSGPYTVYCAHYDKAYDDPSYQGASDNTAAVSVLLAAVSALSRTDGAGDRAFLFTGQEESGLGGAAAFVTYVSQNHIAVREVIDFDSLGRGRLTIRPSAEFPGFVFAIPALGDFVFDGNQLRSSPVYERPSQRLVQALMRAQPDMAILDSFTALSDSNVFQAKGIDTVAISAEDQHYLQLAWDTYADRVELLDERNLERALELVTAYPASQANP